jgi:putative DNA primase/helicase
MEETIDDVNEKENIQTAEFFFPLHDIGNAERFVSQHGELFRYCQELKCWLIYIDGKWEIQQSKTRLYQMLKQTIKSVYEEARREDFSSDQKEELLDHAKKTSSKGRMNAMLDLASMEESVQMNAKDFNSNPWQINCANGTLNLQTKELQAHEASDYMTKKIATVYNKDAACLEWNLLLETVMNGDRGKINFLRRIFGYALTGETNEQCLFVFYGSGANGKSTIIEAFRDLLGEYAMNMSAESLLQSKAMIRNDIARLTGARFVSAVEIGMDKKLNESLIKQLTGGDQVTARFLYQENFEFKPEFKLVIAANHKPEIKGVDNGIWRRIYIIPFDVTIPSEEIDKDLPVKLRQELPGILAWAVQGCYDWQEQGLNPPDSIKHAIKDYRSEMDTIKGFIEDICDTGSDERVPLGDLYSKYQEWSDQVCQDALGKKEFGNLMRQKGYSQSKSGGVRYWKGLILKSES